MSDEWVKKNWNIYKMEYFPATRTKKEILAFVIIQMDLEDIMLSKINANAMRFHVVQNVKKTKIKINLWFLTTKWCL